MASASTSLAYTEAELSYTQFKRLGDFIQSRFGIHMSEAKKVMLEGRLRRRLRALGLDSFGPYCDRVLGGDQEELVHMIDEVTTNTTHFFRESAHFDYLTEVAVPRIVADRRPGPAGDLRVWSAACSSGEEPYTLAMVLAELSEGVLGLRWRILATDISTEILERAIHATYPEERVEPIPMKLRRKYLLRKADGAPVVRIVRELRARVTFRQYNLLESNCIRCTDPVLCRAQRKAHDEQRWKRACQEDGGGCSGGGIVSLPSGAASSSGSRRARVLAQYLGASSR